MARRAFYSFHYKPDCSRAEVRSMGVIEGDPPVTDNAWETIKRGGDAAIERWIEGQLFGKSVTIVLIGAETAGRKWITHEIRRTWDAGKAILGIHIHGLKDLSQLTTTKGTNPFDCVTLDNRPLSGIVTTYDPRGFDSKGIYAAIHQGLPAWIESAIAIRKQYRGATV